MLTAYAKSMATKVLKKEDTNSVFTLVRIKKLVDIGLIPQSLYMYGLEEQEDEDANEAAAAIWSGGTAGGIAKNSNIKATMMMISRKSNIQSMKSNNQSTKSSNQSFYMHGLEEQEDEDSNEAAAAIWSGGTAGGISKKSNIKATMMMILRKSNNQLMKSNNQLTKSSNKVTMKTMI
jgi:hypothetical protein